jgi:phage-related protein
MMARKLILVLLSLFLGVRVFAQSNNGQICIRAFEDRNGNSSQDANEPPITRSISVTISDSQGVIIETAMIEDSPNVTGGILCFQRLAAGSYTVRVTSAEYNPTTPNEFVIAIDNTGVPQVFTFGGQVIESTNNATSTNFSLSAAEPHATAAGSSSQAIDRPQLQMDIMNDSGFQFIVATVIGLIGIILAGIQVKQGRR